MEKIFTAAHVPIDWDHQQVTASTQLTMDHPVIQSVQKHGVGLKGPLGTPIGKGHMSLNLGLRKALKLCVRWQPSSALPHLSTDSPRPAACAAPPHSNNTGCERS